MGEMIKLTSADGFAFHAYQVLPNDAPKGGIMVIQEIFGVNAHIREVADSYAAQGYAVLAPCIFDRARAGIELGYDEAGMNEGIDVAFNQLKMEQTIADLAATATALTTYGKIGVVGYCFGGLLAYLAACQIADVTAASAYYGGGIADALAQKPRAPIIFHFGERDEHIPMAQVEAVKAALPDAPVYVYPADHGFNCDHRASYDEQACATARQRTLAFFATHIG